MEKMISYNKLSKKAKREINNKKRKSWDCNPITKIVKSKKEYNRQLFKKGGYFFII